MASKKTLLILAAGLGSRYNGLKQIDSILENGHVILEYSFYDAIKAGFNKIVIIINPQIPQEFKAKIEDIANKKNVELHWVVQETTTKVPEEFRHIERQKPWGTCHAILCAQDVINETFTVINADDYYGQDIYKIAARISDQENNTGKPAIYNVAFPVNMTVTENGNVCRGVCQVNEEGKLTHIEEICSICKDGDKVYYEANGEKVYIDPSTPVSMNFWVFPAEILKKAEEDFREFLSQNPDPKKEFFIPTLVQKMIDHNEADVFVELSPTTWKGVTYANDKPEVQAFLQQQIDEQKYPKNLWS